MAAALDTCAPQVEGKKWSQKAWKLRMPWGQNEQPDIEQGGRHQVGQQNSGEVISSSSSVSSIARAFLLSRRRLRLDPDKNLHFLYEPGKQVSSAIKIKNVSRSHVAFKFQTTAPKSCFMRPPSGVLPPNGSIIATVVKFVEQPERPQEKKNKDKFKIVSLAVKADVEYTPELFEEQKEVVAVERILRVVFIDPQRASPEELERLQKRLAEAEAAEAARKKPKEEKIPKGTLVVEGLVIDEWKQRRENYLARQQVEGADSL
ncbi:hypothetical protein CY35_17G026700 [Sphagnum magellanicum]|nr:hypothetical protein CY35_17G026700 [Sphagnum magellanicum]KAH9534896.1 hypothetical protein CY35_17G026700 [Sphagnum magellanicum]